MKLIYQPFACRTQKLPPSHHQDSQWQSFQTTEGKTKTFLPFLPQKKAQTKSHTQLVSRADIIGPKCTTAVTEQSSYEIVEGLLLSQ